MNIKCFVKKVDCFCFMNPHTPSVHTSMLALIAHYKKVILSRTFGVKTFKDPR